MGKLKILDRLPFKKGQRPPLKWGGHARTFATRLTGLRSYSIAGEAVTPAKAMIREMLKAGPPDRQHGLRRVPHMGWKKYLTWIDRRIA